MRRPGEITLVALGPLTTVALALKQAPEIVPLLRSFVFMGGSYGGRGNVPESFTAEFNTWADPEALHICLEKIPRSVMVG